MGKYRFRAYLDQAVFVLLIMAGALMSAVFEVRGVREVAAAGKSGDATTVAATVPAAKAPALAASATRSAGAAILLARLSH
jgi:hypothetical protein